MNRSILTDIIWLPAAFTVCFVALHVAAFAFIR
jgi:hypothetical protein